MVDTARLPTPYRGDSRASHSVDNVSCRLSCCLNRLYNKKMNSIITQLATHDAPKLQKLNELFGAVFEDTDNYQAHPPRDEYLADFLAQGQNIVLVAEHNGQIVGGLVAYCLTKFEQERKEVYLYDLAVSADHQRQGIGKMLMNELRAVAKSMGAYVVFVQADEGDEAVAFYESLGPTENLRTRNFDFEVL